jgi:hypothetical protein
MAPGAGIAPASPRLQRGANLSQLPGERVMVVRRGNAPRSLAYQASALLLSYGTVLADGEGWQADWFITPSIKQLASIAHDWFHRFIWLLVMDWRKAPVMPGPGDAGLVFGTSAASLYLPAFRELAARIELAPILRGLTGRRATLTLPGNGAAGRSPTCMVPFRRRMPLCSATAALEMVSAAGIAPAVPRFQAGHVAATPRAVADPKGFAPSTLPQTTGRSAY